jgi:hypothetical protein
MLMAVWQLVYPANASTYAVTKRLVLVWQLGKHALCGVMENRNGRSDCFGRRQNESCGLVVQRYLCRKFFSTSEKNDGQSHRLWLGFRAVRHRRAAHPF